MTELFISALTLGQEEPNTALLLWGIILGAAAIVIIALELVVPSGGLLALGAGACIIASIVAFFVYDAFAGWLSLAVYLILGPIAFVFGFRWWMESPLARRFVLSSEVDRLDTGESEEGAPPVEEDHNLFLRDLIGEEGEALTALRPVGTVRIRGERIEALAEGGSIARGARIVVTDVYDNQVKVREKQ